MSKIPAVTTIAISQKIAWWLNLGVAVIAGMPMLAITLKDDLHPHFYGVIGPGCALITFLIFQFQNHQKSQPYPKEFSQQIAWWLNLSVLVIAGLPMIVVPLKEFLPPHFYGVVGPGAALITFVILQYQNHRKQHPFPTDQSDGAGA